jgi:hypothetical protein
VWGRDAPSAGPPPGPFLEVEGAFKLLMCGDCQVTRGGSRTAAPTTQAATGAAAELLADHDPGQPWYQWGCALCEARVIWPRELEGHTAETRPGWPATYEIVRPYPRQRLRVVYRRARSVQASELSAATA